MKTIYIVQDDQGMLEAGSKEICFKAVVSWAKSEEAKTVYRNCERVEIIDQFSRKENIELEEFESHGFKIEPIANIDEGE